MDEKWYVGLVKGTPKMAAFSSDTSPSPETHGEKFGFFIGPFQTKRGAEYAAKIGIKAKIQGIPEYERLASLELTP